jgi:hypothetical protein
MNVEVVQLQPDFEGMGEMDIHQGLGLEGKVAFGAVFRHLYMPPALSWTERHEQVRCSLPLVMIIIASSPSGAAGKGRREHL